MVLVALLYGVVACGLAVYGVNALFLTALFFRHGRAAERPVPLDGAALPHVTVQLPVYNERYVATRLIDAACRMDYPRARLEIQVLDDSDDETVDLIAARVVHWRRHGVRISHLRRPTRAGYKAGALQWGLERAHGEWIAIFDADFVPPRDWLRRIVAHTASPGAERLGMIQSRWSHLNADYSPLTRAQALALDGHFGVEQAARSAGGLLLNFNGTAGLWRRDCIVQAGGWSAATLCEDLDLSYRAQLGGWRLLYDGSIAAPAEIPAQIGAYKRQQARWARGSIQVARRLSGAILRGALTPLQKIQALIHITGYLVHPLLLALLLLSLPLLLLGWPSGFSSQQALLTWAGLAGLGAPILYGVAQQRLYGPGWGRRYRWMPLLVLLGSGVALSNSRAVLGGLFGRPGGEFRRTPKFRLEGREGDWRGRAYSQAAAEFALGELALALYALACAAAALWRGQVFAVPFLLLYALAFGWVGLLTLRHGGRMAGPTARSLRPRLRSRDTL